MEFKSTLKCFNFRVMPHSQPVTRITVHDNPKQKAPKYPGKYCRNNKHGVIQTKDEWLNDQTDQWIKHMLNNPAYKKTYTSDKVLTLLHHLSKSLRSGTLDYPKCKKLLQSAEQ